MMDRQAIDPWLNKVHCGDALELLKLMPDCSVDLVLTDPPYPKMKGGLSVTFTSGVSKLRNVNKTVSDPWGANMDWLVEAWRVTKHGILCFCSFHSVHTIPYILNVKPEALVTWFQRNAMPSMNNSQHFQTEFIWAFKKYPGLKWRNLKTHYDIPRLQAGCMANERIVNESGEALHKCQKPILLMKHLLSIGGEVILDPFCGTGTTCSAAGQQGKQWIGIDKDPDYCAMAEDRIKRETAQLNMFTQMAKDARKMQLGCTAPDANRSGEGRL